MADQKIFEEKLGPASNELTVDTIDVANCCRVCLRIECSLVEITSLDDDSIKFSDKLMACVAEVMWLKEGLPSLICSNCIELLGIAYNFRNRCLQSDRTFTKYIAQMQHEKKLEKPQAGSTIPVEGEAKFEFTSTQVVLDIAPCIKEEPPNSPQIDSVDNNDLLVKSEPFIETGEVEITNIQYNIVKSDSAEVIQAIQLHQDEQLIHQQNESQLQHEMQVQQQMSQQKRSRSPEVTLDGVQSKSYTCTVCNKTYKMKRSLKLHMRRHTGEMPFECKYCKKRFYHPADYGRHIRRHVGEKRFHCAVCNRKFIAKYEVARHMTVHTDEKPFACTFCDQKCATKANLKAHMKKHSGESFECHYCKKQYDTPWSLREHVKRHTGEKTVQCGVCNKQYPFKSELIRHMRSHTGEKPFACTVCNHRCLTNGNLKLHMRSHTGERPYSCDTCGKKFASKHSWNYHIRTHTGQNEYTCKICKRTFKHSSSLNNHIKKHAGEKAV